MKHDLPLIRGLSRRLLVESKLAVRRFARIDRYETGAELVRDARAVARAADRAWFGSAQRATHIQGLVEALDDFKLTLQIAKDLEAFQGWRQFDAIWRLTTDLGKQCGGWHRQHHPKGRNPVSASRPPLERAKRLSAHAASQHEANP